MIVEYTNPDDGGRYLSCNQCQSKTDFDFQMCRHILYAIRNSTEEADFDHDNEGLYYLYVTMQSPVVSSHFENLPHAGWCKIKLSKPILGEYQTVTLIGGFSWMTMSWSEDIGLITKDEGRLIAARMVYAYIESKLSPLDLETRGNVGIPKTKCNSSSHSWQEIKELNKMLKPDSETPLLGHYRTRHFATMVIDGACVACQMSLDNDDDEDWGLGGVNQGNSFRNRFR